MTWDEVLALPSGLVFDYAAALELARRESPPWAGSFRVLDPRAGFLADQGGNITSQNGEDGFLAALFERIGTRNRACFEVGAHDGLYLSNTWALRQIGWQALLIEGDGYAFTELTRRFHGTATLVEKKITPSNLDSTLDYWGWPVDLDLGVIDIDGQDLQVWEGMTKFRPRVMLVEINEGGDGILGGVGVWQAGIESIVPLGVSKGYVPLLKCGCNVLFVERNEISRLDKPTAG